MVRALELAVEDDEDVSDSESVVFGKVPFNAMVSVPLTGPM